MTAKNDYPTAATYNIAPADLNDLDAWFYRPPRDPAAAPPAPDLPATLDAAHDALVGDYERKRAAAEAKRDRYAKRRWAQRASAVIDT
jgi:hypothetical protein